MACVGTLLHQSPIYEWEWIGLSKNKQNKDAYDIEIKLCA